MLAQRLAPGRVGQPAAEVFDGAEQTVVQRDLGLESEQGPRAGDVRAALLRIVGWQRAAHNLGARAGELDDLARKLCHGVLAGIAEIDGTVERVEARDADDAFDEIAHVAEGARLLAGAEQGDGLAAQGLKPDIALEIDGVAAILELVADGAGSAVLSRNAVATSGRPQAYALRPISPKLRSRLYVAVSSQRPTTLTQQAMLELIQQTARELLR